MRIIRRRGWEIPEREATPEGVWLGRRALIAGSFALGAGALLPGAAEAQLFNWGSRAEEAPPDPTADLYPAPRNARYELDRPVTDERQATTYNNFYEFGSHKQIWRAAQRLPIRPWEVVIDGMVERPMRIGVDELVRRMPLEERLYRFRCVEAWAMAVPFSGFQLSHLLELARPLGSATYLHMQTFGASEVPASVATGLRQSWYPWAYTEGLTMAEAANELAFVATGMYGKPIPRQNGAPLRLVTPWKYGFKSAKSLVRFTFSDQRPRTFWEVVQPNEYGFWANVNPAVPHPRWSQATERMLGSGETRPTLIFNGYGDFVAHLYEGNADPRLFM